MTLSRAQAVYLAARRALDAWFVRFDPTGTGLASTNVQDAIAEVAAGGGGGGSAWGAIAGTLSAQTDLQAALDAKVPTTRTVNGHALSANLSVTAGDVGLGSVDNTSDMAKPVSTATATALGAKLDTTAAPELIRDTIGAALVAGSNVTVTVNDPGDTITIAATGGGGTGDVVGPASAVSGNVPTFSGTTGKLLQDSGKAMNAAGVGLGSVTNDAQTKAAVVPNTAPAAGQLLAGNAGGTAYAPVSLSGDATLASTGALSLTGPRVLANVTLGSPGTTLSSGTIAACRFLEVHLFIAGVASADTPSLQFNASGGTAYRYKWTHQNAAASTWTNGNTAVSTDRVKVGSNDKTNTRRVRVDISNDATITEKVLTFSSAVGTGSAASQGQIDLGSGAWVSGASTQITQIDLISTSNMTAGTQMVVIGWN